MARRTLLGWLLVLVALAGLIWAAWTLLRGEMQSPAEPAAAIKILVETEGMIAVPLADLRKFGWADPDPAALRLERGGEPVPLFVEGSGRDLRLVFYGRPPEPPFDRYARAAAYFLYPEGGQTLPIQEAAEAAPGETSVQETAPSERMLEENLLYIPELLEGRPWFWEQIPAPGSRTHAFDLEAAPAGAAELTVEWIGSTESAEVDPDHHVRVHVNGVLAAEEWWDGAGPHTMQVTLEAGLLQAGENEIVLEAPGDTGVLADIVLLDRIAVRMQQPFEPAAGGQAFTAELAAIRLVNDRSDAYLFDLMEPAGGLQPAGSRDLLATQPGREYVLVYADEFAAPAGLTAAEELPATAQAAGAEYVAIGHPDLLEALGPLLEAREAQGLSTLAVPFAAVADRFGAGMATPHAIREFLRFAAENWAVPPRYVLLAGDWSHDPLGYLAEPEEAWLPSFLMFTEYGGETVSDVEIAQLDDDGLPDLALGRIPARNPEQVRVLVEKILAFEGAAPGDWSQRVLAVADGTERSFAADAQRFLDGFSGDFNPVLLAPPAGAQGAAEDIAGEIDAGLLLFAYFGHGSIDQLGKDRLFTAEDARSLQNGNPAPVMVSITCLVGLFTHPEVESLTEAMLWNPDGGASAALAATSLTLPVFQAYLSDGFVAALVDQPGVRLGDALLEAQRRMPVDLGPGAVEVLDTFLLFGDPAALITAQD